MSGERKSPAEPTETRLVSIITDFGLSDNYVGQLKAVMLGIAPWLRMVDITHQISPQDVAEAAFQLATSWETFPSGAIHLVVVDPGVGTIRRPIAFAFRRHYFVMPDNGVGHLLLQGAVPERAVILDRPEFQRTPISNTFHGRDIFAPVAAHLASGRLLTQVGTPIDPNSLARLRIGSVEHAAGEVRGSVVSIDYFGNCRTLIRRVDVSRLGGKVEIHCNGVVIHGIAETYASVAEGQTIALFGSHGGLEIVVREGHAANHLGIQRGDVVRVSSTCGS